MKIDPNSPAFPADRFWAKVDRSGGPDACWNWTASLGTKGYGHIKVGGKMLRSHRLSWEIRNGPIPNGLRVCHSCDNRRCCNPSHLWLGTDADNIRDRDAKGRQTTPRGDRNGSRTRPDKVPRGFKHGSHTKPQSRPRLESHGCAKLTREAASEIRTLWRGRVETQTSMAQRFGVSRRAIQMVISGETWRDALIAEYNRTENKP